MRPEPGRGWRATGPQPALFMHLPPQDALLSMGDAGGGGGFSLAGPLLRSPGSGGPSSRLHSIEAILGFTKEDPRLGSFQGQEGSGGAKPGKEAAEKMGAGGEGFSQMPAQEALRQEQASPRTGRFGGEGGDQSVFWLLDLNIPISLNLSRSNVASVEVIFKSLLNSLLLLKRLFQCQSLFVSPYL